MPHGTYGLDHFGRDMRDDDKSHHAKEKELSGDQHTPWKA